MAGLGLLSGGGGGVALHYLVWIFTWCGAQEMNCFLTARIRNNIRIIQYEMYKYTYSTNLSHSNSVELYSLSSIIEYRIEEKLMVILKTYNFI